MALWNRENDDHPKEWSRIVGSSFRQTQMCHGEKLDDTGDTNGDDSKIGI